MDINLAAIIICSLAIKKALVQNEMTDSETSVELEMFVKIGPFFPIAVAAQSV
jgi:hypothetical protein